MGRSFIAITFLGLAIILFFGWTMPIWNDIKELKAERSAYAKALISSRDLQDIRDRLLTQYNSISQEDLERLNVFLPTSVDAGGLITEFENRAQANGLTLKKISIQTQEVTKTKSTTLKAPSESLFESAVVDLRVSGSYESFLSFLKDLEQSLRLIDVQQLSFISGTTDSYEFNIQGKVYYQK